MAKQFLFWVFTSVMLIQFSLQSTHTFHTCFTQDPTSNNIIQGFDNVVLSSGKDGYQSSVDPNTIPGYRKGVIAYWPMDTSSSGYTPDTSIPGTSPGKLVGVTINTSGGKFKGGVSLNANGYMLVSDGGPLLSFFAIKYGFTYGVWVKPTDLSSAVTVLEQEFSQPSLTLKSNAASCFFHNSTTGSSGVSVPLTNPLNTWTYLACRYDPLQGLSVCANGGCSAWSGFITDGLGGSSAHTSVGSRPPDPSGSVTNGFIGTIDELMVWNRPLSNDEVAGISAATSQVIPYYGGIFTSAPLNTTDLGIADSSIIDFWGVSPTWTISPIGSATSNPAIGTMIEISTNGGITWCPAPVGETLNFNHTICTWPAAYVQFRFTIVDNVVVKCLDLLITVQPEMTWNYFPLGMNQNPYHYFATSWVYTDAFKSAGSWNCGFKPCDGIEFDENWWPVRGINTSYGANTLMLSQDNFPHGNFTFVAEGEGTVKLASACSSTFSFNGTIAKTVPCNKQSSYYISLTIQASNPANPVRNIKMIFPGMESIYQNQKFHPLYLDRFNGTKVARFMDWSDTNSNNIAHWEDRNLPSFAIQRMGKQTVLPITKFIDASQTGTSIYLGTKWLVKITTSGAHGLVTGQRVSIVTNPPASATMKLSDGSTYVADLSTLSGYVDPIDSTSFYMSYDSGSFGTSPTLTSFVGSTGTMTLSVSSGNPYEDMIEYCNTINSHVWINIPVAATDDYVAKFATLLRNDLNPNLKIYVEYSNEIWNIDFIQSDIVARMGLANGLSATNNVGDARQRQTVLRVSQILSIFKTVFGDSEFNRRIVKLIPSQLSSNLMDILLTHAMNSTLNPGGFAFDGIAGAPYFGGSINKDVHDVMAKGETPSVHFVLDLTRDAMMGRTLSAIRGCKAVADKYGVKLFAYEGGPGLIPERGAFKPNQTQIYTAANRHPRIKNIYKQFFYQWMASGADVHVTFTNYVGPTDHGIWGTLEYQDQPLETAYRYQAWKEVLQLTQGVMPNTPEYIDPYTPGGSNGPSGETDNPSQQPSSNISSAEQIALNMVSIYALLVLFLL